MKKKIKIVTLLLGLVILQGTINNTAVYAGYNDIPLENPKTPVEVDEQ